MKRVFVPSGEVDVALIMPLSLSGTGMAAKIFALEIPSTDIARFVYPSVILENRKQNDLSLNVDYFSEEMLEYSIIIAVQESKAVRDDKE